MITQELLHYIAAQLKHNISPEQIKASLVSSGWQQQDVEQAIKQVQSGNTQAPPPPPQAFTPQSSSEPSDTTKMLITLLLLFVFFPGGIICMWIWMKQWPLWLKLLITLFPIIIMLFVFVLIGFIFTRIPLSSWKTTHDYSHTQTIITPPVFNYQITPSQNQQVQTTDTSSWKTYISTKDRLSFKYPGDWKLTNQTPYNPNINSAYDSLLLTGGTQGQLQIIPSKAVAGQHIISNWQPNTSLTIDGVNCQGIKVSFAPGMQNPPNIGYECVVNGIMYYIGAVAMLNQDHTEDYSVDNVILSTFKFTQ